MKQIQDELLEFWFGGATDDVAEAPVEPAADDVIAATTQEGPVEATVTLTPTVSAPATHAAQAC